MLRANSRAMVGCASELGVKLKQTERLGESIEKQEWRGSGGGHHIVILMLRQMSRIWLVNPVVHLCAIKSGQLP